MMIMMLMMMMMMMDSTQHLGVRSLYVMSRADLTLPYLTFGVGAKAHQR